ncbi:MAG: SUMF1/EgtB/PvdO family nonheme iron enzyme [Spirochaetes bacterium]|nr:SUMF1/EgtB/PvdO family nonheme iron enzyme [Spirochaetota bacterium]
MKNLNLRQTQAGLLALLLACSPKAAQREGGGDCPKEIPAGMACIPGGTYTLGTNRKDFKKELPELTAFAEHKAELSAFLIDKYEVTTREYQACVGAKQCSFTQSNYPHMRGPAQPQLKANWFQADAYCRAQGKRLPTEAEFEAASRGPQGEDYPWGNEPATCERAIIQEQEGRGCPSKKAEKGFLPTPQKFEHTGNTWEVGSRPVGRYGLYDMAGNAQEWVSDWFVESLAKCGAACTGRNPQGPGPTKQKLVKGGSWYWGPMSALAAVRRPYEPKNDPPHHFGFRCAKSL